jgi:hypothetical protein
MVMIVAFMAIFEAQDAGCFLRVSGSLSAGCAGLFCVSGDGFGTDSAGAAACVWAVAAVSVPGAAFPASGACAPEAVAAAAFASAA